MNILHIGCHNGKDHVLDFCRKNKDSINQITLVDANMEVLKKAELFRKLVTEIDISKYKQKEFEKIVNLIYTDVFRIELWLDKRSIT